MIECYMCGREYDPTRHRWMCPYCRCKDTCCMGEPLPLKDCD